jgi:hypothetical protein
MNDYEKKKKLAYELQLISDPSKFDEFNKQYNFDNIIEKIRNAKNKGQVEKCIKDFKSLKADNAFMSEFPRERSLFENRPSNCKNKLFKNGNNIAGLNDERIYIYHEDENTSYCLDPQDATYALENHKNIHTGKMITNDVLEHMRMWYDKLPYMNKKRTNPSGQFKYSTISEDIDLAFKHQFEYNQPKKLYETVPNIEVQEPYIPEPYIPQPYILNNDENQEYNEIQHLEQLLETRKKNLENEIKENTLTPEKYDMYLIISSYLGDYDSIVLILQNYTPQVNVLRLCLENVVKRNNLKLFDYLEKMIKNIYDHFDYSFEDNKLLNITINKKLSNFKQYLLLHFKEVRDIYNNKTHYDSPSKSYNIKRKIEVVPKGGARHITEFSLSQLSNEKVKSPGHRKPKSKKKPSQRKNKALLQETFDLNF